MGGTGDLDGLLVLGADEVHARLTFEAAIPAVREAMIALSDGRVRQLLRSFIGLGEGRTFAIMPAALSERGVFGAKLISVFKHPDGSKAHEGLVMLFDPGSGAPICLADAGAITAIRTAAASAVATEALARPAADSLAILGTGLQAKAHVQAIAQVRPLREIRIWGRAPDRAEALAAAVFAETGVAARAMALEDTVRGADIVCTVTSAADPILRAGMVSPGAHLNVVGSSGPAQAEVDGALVAASRFVVDHREHVLAHGGEFLRAKAAGLVDETQIAAEIGEVLAGAKPGRTSADEITLYKSLGHAAQDLAVAAWLYQNITGRPL